MICSQFVVVIDMLCSALSLFAFSLLTENLLSKKYYSALKIRLFGIIVSADIFLLITFPVKRYKNETSWSRFPYSQYFFQTIRHLYIRSSSFWIALVSTNFSACLNHRLIWSIKIHTIKHTFHKKSMYFQTIFKPGSVVGSVGYSNSIEFWVVIFLRS